MMHHLFTLLFASLVFANGWAQINPVVTPVIDQLGFIRSMNPKPETLAKGSVYLNEEWIPSNINFKRGSFNTNKLEGVSIKVDLMTNMIEINSDYGIKLLNVDRVDTFEWINPDTKAREVYTNCNQFTVKGNRLESFCLTYGNDVKLVKQHYIAVLKADYNVSLNVGSKYDRIVKKSKLYLLKEKTMVELNRKAVQSLIAGKEKVKVFIRKNHLNLNEEKDLRSLVDFYNDTMLCD